MGQHEDFQAGTIIDLLVDMERHLASISTSLATLAAEPYRPTKNDIVAVRDAAGSSLYRASDALVRYRGDVAAAIEYLAPAAK